MDSYLVDGEGELTFLFAHGAGAGMDHDFMQAVASGLAQKGIRVVRFNFPYMVKRAEDGKRRPPDRAPKLLEAFEQHIEHIAGGSPIVIGGKSMGGRMASLLGENPLVAGIACLGFPFHPPGKPENFKGEQLATLDKPCLILQGERDTFGNQDDVAGYSLSDSITLKWIPDGDHGFKPRKKSGHTEQGNIELTVRELEAFIRMVNHAD